MSLQTPKDTENLDPVISPNEDMVETGVEDLLSDIDHQLEVKESLGKAALFDEVELNEEVLEFTEHSEEEE